MTLDFDFNSVQTVEFGIGRDEVGGDSFFFVPVEAKVQDALCEMATGTWEAMQTQANTVVEFEPSEKYASVEYIVLPLESQLADRLRHVHYADNLTTDHAALSRPADVFCYFARLTDRQGKRVTCLRRAVQFKGVLKSRLIRFDTDTLKIVEDKVFKLDMDFDLLVDSIQVHILRPSSFEFMGKLQDAVLEAVSYNIGQLETEIPFVDFSGIALYASKRPRAARYLASIRSQGAVANIEIAALKGLCYATGVELSESNGTIVVRDGHEMGFLEVLDRRRYTVELVNGAPERFRAASRSRLADRR